MLSGLRFWLSARRRRFMRALGSPSLAKLKARLATAGSPAATSFCSILLDANAEYLAFALSSDGPLAGFAEGATPERVEVCLVSMLIYSIAQFAREEMRRDDSQLLPLLARTADIDIKHVMIRRDQLRKAPRSEEWMLYGWLASDLGAERPAFDAQLEREFSYGYLSYIGQYRSSLEKALANLES